MKNNSFDKLTKKEIISLLEKSKQQNNNMLFLLENINGISWEFNLAEDKFTYISSNAKQILGYELSEWRNFQSWVNMIYEKDRALAVELCTIGTKKGKNHFMEYRMVKKSGEIVWIFDTVTVITDEYSNSVKLYGILIDITSEKETRLALEKERNYLHSIINNVSEPIMVIREDYTIELMNEAVNSQLHKIKIADLKNPKCYEVSHHRETPCDSNDHPCPLKDVMQSKEIQNVVHKHFDVEGNEHFVELTATPLFDANKNCIGIIESSHNITEHVSLVQELEDKSRLLDFKAHHDNLTSLPNRALFMDRLNQSIESCNRNNKCLALIFIDLDDFKRVNDTLGHDVGDEILKEVARRIKSLLRATDTLSRLGGDEFTAIIKDVKQRDNVSVLTNKIIKAFELPFNILGNLIEITCSLGISIYPESSKNELIKHADKAMYKAKKQGKNNFQYYNNKAI